MKYCLALLTAALSMVSCNGYCQAKNPLVGTWQLVNSKGTYKENVINSDSSKVYMIKVITPTLMFFTQYSKATDSLLMAAQGPITMIGNTYTETISNASAKIMKGMKFTYTSTLSGNKWRIEGGGNELKLVEEWVRIE